MSLCISRQPQEGQLHDTMEERESGETTESADNSAASTDEGTQEVGEQGLAENEEANSFEVADDDEEPTTTGQGAGAVPSPVFRTSKGKGGLRIGSEDEGRSGGAGSGGGEISPGKGATAAAGAGSSDDKGGKGIFDACTSSSEGTGGAEGSPESRCVDTVGKKTKDRKKKMFQCVICLMEDDEEFLQTPCCSATAQ